MPRTVPARNKAEGAPYSFKPDYVDRMTCRVWDFRCGRYRYHHPIHDLVPLVPLRLKVGNPPALEPVTPAGESPPTLSFFLLVWRGLAGGFLYTSTPVQRTSFPELISCRRRCSSVYLGETVLGDIPWTPFDVIASSNQRPVTPPPQGLLTYPLALDSVSYICRGTHW